MTGRHDGADRYDGTDRYDEADAKVRPNPRGSRPRSKQRPQHDEARWGSVLLVDRGRFHVGLRDDGPDRTVVAMRARELGRRALAVGDRVAMVGDLTGAPGSLARIVAINPRRTTLRRSADDADPVERVIVANADQLAVVVSTADPEPRFGFIDRALVAGFDGGLSPLLVVTKQDLAPPDLVRSTYAALDVPTVSVQRGTDPGELRDRLAGLTTVFIGQSGVGKSTLVNALVPAAARATGSVNEVTGRGRHTSTSVAAIPLIGAGWIIDTPGVRSFGLAHVTVDRVIHAFGDLEAGTAQCPRACAHLDQYCALDDYVASGAAGPAAIDRLASLRRLLAALGGNDWGKDGVNIAGGAGGR